ARMAALEAGDITSTGIDPSQVAKFKKSPNIVVHPERQCQSIFILRGAPYKGHKSFFIGYEA
ncbi:MAG: hypothetical protein HW399_158, partial [Dehalococcoidia bacterium]|nr:hypothetical protein [Dehalococcoidia bacterium]